jgi:hypothetical protein
VQRFIFRLGSEPQIKQQIAKQVHGNSILEIGFNTVNYPDWNCNSKPIEKLNRCYKVEVVESSGGGNSQ